MNKRSKKMYCSSCGAPVTTEICPYCMKETGIKSMDANMEYPVIECKEASGNFFNSTFFLVFFVCFFLLPVLVFIFCNPGDFMSWLGIVVVIVAFIMFITPRIRAFMIKRKGKNIDAIVYGYMDDDIMLNNRPTQIVKLLVYTKVGPRFILYQLSDVVQPYPINTKIKLMVYKNYFLILDDK